MCLLHLKITISYTIIGSSNEFSIMENPEAPGQHSLSGFYTISWKSSCSYLCVRKKIIFHTKTTPLLQFRVS